MPIYEYACMECESHFEELVRGDEQPACPECGAANVLRQLSTFVAHGARVEAGVSAPRPRGGCCGGGCGCG
jgi:putative FmdB family regulatory protein